MNIYRAVENMWWRLLSVLNKLFTMLDRVAEQMKHGRLFEELLLFR